MTWRRPWWLHARRRDREALRLIAFLDGRTLYGLVQLGSDGNPSLALSGTEPTGVWMMLSVDEPTTDLWLSCVRTVFRQASVGAVKSPNTCVTTTVPMLWAFMHRACAFGAHVWVSPWKCRRFTMRTATDACTWLRTHVPDTSTISPAISSAVDQLIAETAPTGKETPP